MTKIAQKRASIEAAVKKSSKIISATIGVVEKAPKQTFEDIGKNVRESIKRNGGSAEEAEAAQRAVIESLGANGTSESTGGDRRFLFESIQKAIQEHAAVEAKKGKQ